LEENICLKDNGGKKAERKCVEYDLEEFWNWGKEDLG
jgi:hypothetical protein